MNAWTQLKNGLSKYSRSRKTFRHSGRFEGVLGTSCEIHVTSRDDKDGPRAIQVALDSIDRLDAIFSTYRAQSEFMLWQSTYNVSTSVSPELLYVLQQAEFYRRISNGAFCPIADHLAQAWSRGEPIPIDPQSPLWEVDLPNRTATRKTPYPATLNAIAKGYIVDQAALAAKSVESVEEVLINIGGDIRHIGSIPIQISIADPRNDAENAPPADVIWLCNQAIATSGGYRRGFVHEGINHSHVFDPIAGQPSEVHQSVSAVADTAMQADAMATIAGILHRIEWLEIIDSLERVGIFIISLDSEPILTSYWSHLRRTHTE